MNGLKLGKVLTLMLIVAIECKTFTKEQGRIFLGCSIVSNLPVNAWNEHKARNFTDPIPEMKCFVHCTLEGLSITKNGVLQQDESVLESINADNSQWPEMRKIMEDCTESNKNTLNEPCNNGYDMFICLKQYPQYFNW